VLCPDETLALDTFKSLAFEGQSAKERQMRRSASAELFAGVVRARPDFAAALLPHVTRLLNELPSGRNWGDAFRFASQRCPAAASVLAAYAEQELARALRGVGIDGEPMGDNEGFMFVSNIMRLCGAVIVEERGLGPRILPMVGCLPMVLWVADGGLTVTAPPHQVLKCFTHPYKAVRELAGVTGAVLVFMGDVDKQVLVQGALQAAAASAEGLETCFYMVIPLCYLGDAALYMDVLLALAVPVVVRAQGHHDVELAALARAGLAQVAGAVRALAVPDLALQLEKVVAEEAGVNKVGWWQLRPCRVVVDGGADGG
jgi:hypothetical protein